MKSLRETEREWHGKQTLLEDRLKNERRAKERWEAQLPPNPEMPDEEGLACFAEIERGQECTLETITELERKASDTPRNRTSQQQRFVNEARGRMGAPMQAFLHAFPEDSKDLLAQADYADDYVRIHPRVTRDDLLTHEERFRFFLNENLTQNIANLDASLAQEVKNHRLRIGQVNATMGFQLILAAPWEAKVRIAESYMSNYHLAVNPEHNTSTIRRASTNDRCKPAFMMNEVTSRPWERMPKCG